MTLKDSPKEKQLKCWKKDKLKAREEVKGLKKATEEATPTSDYVKIFQDLFPENAKLKEDPTGKWLS